MDGKSLRDVLKSIDTSIQKIRQRKRGVHEPEQNMNICPADIEVTQHDTLALFRQ
jgi:hypothetical protein